MRRRPECVVDGPRAPEMEPAEIKAHGRSAKDGGETEHASRALPGGSCVNGTFSFLSFYYIFND
jgi:hypothetical protein